MPRTMTVRAKARKHLVISTWAPSCHCPHFTDDKVTWIGEVQCLTASLQPGSRTHAQNHTTCTTSLEKHPEPCLPPETLLPASLLRTESSLTADFEKSCPNEPKASTSDTAHRPYRAQPQPGAQQSLGRTGWAFPIQA